MSFVMVQSHWIKGGGLHPVDCCPFQKATQRPRHTRREGAHMTTEAERTDCGLCKPRDAKIAGNHQKPEEAKEAFFLESSVGAWSS